MRRLWLYPLSFVVLFVAAWFGMYMYGRLNHVCEPVVVVKTETINTTTIVTQTPQPAIDCGTFMARVRLNVPQGFLNIRPRPTTDFAPIGVVAEGGIVEVLDQSNPDWLKVRIADIEGWVYRKYVGEIKCSGG